MTQRPRPAARAVGFGALAAVVVTVLLFPFVSGGGCAEAGDDAGQSTCFTFLRSVVGIDTSIWFWLGGLAIVLFFTVLAVNKTVENKTTVNHTATSRN